MNMHVLASSLDAVGLTRQDRYDALVEELLLLPPLVRRELLRELRFLLSELTDLEPIVVNALNEADSQRQRSPKTA